jgi:hypothetical protein
MPGYGVQAVTVTLSRNHPSSFAEQSVIEVKPMRTLRPAQPPAPPVIALHIASRSPVSTKLDHTGEHRCAGRAPAGELSMRLARRRTIMVRERRCSSFRRARPSVPPSKLLVTAAMVELQSCCVERGHRDAGCALRLRVVEVVGRAVRRAGRAAVAEDPGAGLAVQA